MATWAVRTLALIFVAAAAGFTPLPGPYKGTETGGVPISLNFDGAHIRDLHIDGHLSTAWSIPRYSAPNFSGGNSDGGFFSGYWTDPTHASGSYRYLSRTTIHKFTLHRVPQPRPGRYHGMASNGSPVSFTLTADHHVRYFNMAYIVNVSATQHGPSFAFHGVHNSRNTSIEGHWSNDHHLTGFVRQTGRDPVDWSANWDAP